MRKLTPPTQTLSLTEQLPKLETLFRQTPGVAAVLLYGSHETPQQTPLSDIDLAVIAVSGQELDELKLSGNVAAIAGDDVSVTVLNSAPLPFRFRVLSIGRPLFIFSQTGLADFTEHTLKYYHDFRPDYEAMVRDYDEALRERYGS